MKYTDLLIKNDNKLREYQAKYKQEIYEAWDNGSQKVMLQMPTGTGKTYLFVSIIRDLQNYYQSIGEHCRILVMAHRKEIIQQICNTLYNKYQVSCVEVSSTNRGDTHADVIVASVQTMAKRVYSYKNKFDLIIIDEAHHTLANSYKSIIHCFPNAKVLGVTATPYRLSGAGFDQEYDKLILSSTIEEFINSGVLSDVEYLLTDIVIHDCNTIAVGVDGDYKKEVLFKSMDQPYIYKAIVDAYLKYANGKKGIIYTIDQNHNTRLRKWFENENISSAAIDSKTPLTQRERIIAQFKKGEIKVLCNVDIFGEGFDCPDVDFIQLARPTKSLSLYLQQVGRGLRRTENKTKVLIIDNVGSFFRFGLPTKNRDWQQYFYGKDSYYYDQLTDTWRYNQIDDTPNINEIKYIRNKRSEYGLSVEIKELKHNEDLTHLSSLFLIENSEISYESQFIEYATSYLKRNDITIKNYIKDIQRIDRYIQSRINNKFTGIFYTNNSEVLKSWREDLIKIDSFIRYDNEFDNKLIKPSFDTYIQFALSRNNKAEIESEWEEELKNHTYQIEIIDRILSNQRRELSKNDLEITIATLSKMGLLWSMSDSMINKLLNRYQQG